MLCLVIWDLTGLESAYFELERFRETSQEGVKKLELFEESERENYKSSCFMLCLSVILS